MQILITTLIALNVRESPKFSRFTRNRARWTRWWRQILDRKLKYSRFAHAQWKICNLTLIIYYRNSLVVVDLLWNRCHVPRNVFLVRNCSLTYSSSSQHFVILWLIPADNVLKLRGSQFFRCQCRLLSNCYLLLSERSQGSFISDKSLSSLTSLYKTSVYIMLS